MGGCSIHLAMLQSCSITHLEINHLPVPTAGADPGAPLAALCRSYHVHYLSVTSNSHHLPPPPHIPVTVLDLPAYDGYLAHTCYVFIYRKAEILTDIQTHANMTSLPPRD
ncbi:hypothetical protein VZT92_017049 [Zoarces viviparus]|uniref:Uncharacterized protein n=1 Tax=Zoarces viviparus TaxID=48416 RepID=A0AAW1ER56_ZOAVI